MFTRTSAVPGLLQTEEYARAVFGTMRPPLDVGSVEGRVAARIARQEIFAKRPNPLLSFVIDESVSRRPIGGRGVPRAVGANPVGGAEAYG